MADASTAVANTLTAISGTHVLLPRPAGFVVAQDFPGFSQKATYSSVMVTELPASFAPLAAGFTKQALAGRGITLLSRQNHVSEGVAGILLHVTQSAAGMTFEKWMYMFGDTRQTDLITATFPQQQSPKLSGLLKTAILSARWDRKKVVDPFSDLRFRISPQPPLKFENRIGNMLMFTKTGDPLHEGAMFCAGYAISDVAQDDRKQSAMQRLAQQPVTNQTVLSTEIVLIDGLNGYESIATGFDKNNSPVTLYQVVLFEDKTYFLMFGLTASSHAKQDLPLFRSTANSLKRR